MASNKGRPGRRPGVSTTREDILDAARKLFAQSGYERTTIRSIAATAGVDPSLIIQFFRTKHGLFVAAVELPVDPGALVGGLVAENPDTAGRRLAGALLDLLDSDATRAPMVGLIRAAASDPDAAARTRELLTERIFGPLVAALPGDHATPVRAALLGTQVAGLMMTRHVIGLDAVAHADRDLLVDLLAPVFQHLITPTDQG